MCKHWCFLKMCHTPVWNLPWLHCITIPWLSSIRFKSSLHYKATSLLKRYSFLSSVCIVSLHSCADPDQCNLASKNCHVICHGSLQVTPDLCLGVSVGWSWLTYLNLKAPFNETWNLAWGHDIILSARHKLWVLKMQI